MLLCSAARNATAGEAFTISRSSIVDFNSTEPQPFPHWMVVLSSVDIPALRVRQGQHVLFCFAVDGKLIPRIATVSRLRRGDSSQLFGYQRPEIQSHVR